jgi:hypothetical protein
MGEPGQVGLQLGGEVGVQHGVLRFSFSGVNRPADDMIAIRLKESVLGFQMMPPACCPAGGEKPA